MKILRYGESYRTRTTDERSQGYMQVLSWPPRKDTEDNRKTSSITIAITMSITISHYSLDCRFLQRTCLRLNLLVSDEDSPDCIAILLLRVGVADAGVTLR